MAVASAGPYASLSRQITTPAPHHSNKTNLFKNEEDPCELFRNLMKSWQFGGNNLRLYGRASLGFMPDSRIEQRKHCERVLA